MKNTRARLLAGFGALASLAFFAAHSDAKPETIIKIVDGVWFREGDLKNLGHCNNIIIEMKDYLIVVDANFPSGARLALADAKKVSSKPVKYVFDTHHHGDHAYGNAIWTQAGATTLAYKGVVDEMKRNWPKVVAAAQKLNVTRVLPGHGEPGGKEVLAGEELYMTELYKAVKSAVGQGKKLSDLVEVKDGKPVKTSLKLPDTVKHWVGDF